MVRVTRHLAEVIPTASFRRRATPPKRSFRSTAIVWRLKRLQIKKRGRNLRAG
jgi:hypothetical protein